MPVIKQDLVLNLAARLAAFLRVEAGVVRRPVPAAGESQPLTRRLKRLQRSNRAKDRRIAELRKQVERSGLAATGSKPDPGQARFEELYGRVRPDKLQLIDYAFRRLGCRSFADLGGIGAVGGGYTFYTMDEFRPERGVLVDVKARSVEDRAARYPDLDLVVENFAEPEVIERAGKVDAVFFFAVLLHQAAPEWYEVLERWANTETRVFLIHNPQWTAGEESVKLLELGEEGYRKNAPPANEELLKAAYERPEDPLEGPFPDQGRPHKDLRHFWQWGITDEDLIARMKSLGFELRYFEDRGPFSSLPNFRNKAFVFVRR